jgi:hypothetical protein
MKKLITAIAATMAFATCTALADDLPSAPSPVINISGAIAYQAPYTNSGSGILKATVKTLSFNNKSLIALLNASPSVTNNLLAVTTTYNQIPTGSWFIWDMSSGGLIITNKNGFSFPLTDSSPSYNYCTLGLGVGGLIGANSINSKTFAGSEQDQTGIIFNFNDDNGNEIECYGSGSLNWTYGTGSSSGQKASVSLNLKGSGLIAQVNGNEGIVKELNISGSGSATIYSILYYAKLPFWYTR